MQRRYTLFLGFLLWTTSTTVSHGFSLLGPLTTPATTWQVPGIGYQRQGDIGGPVNLGEEYRWNIPTITYAFDGTFLNFFGQKGVIAVEEALSIINNLGPLSGFSPDLSEFPNEALKPNGEAAALGILDLKTTTLSIVLELLGLADSRRWVYALRDRTVSQNPTFTNYYVIQRNFDPVTPVPSRFINDDFYVYTVQEPLKPGDYADALEFSLPQPDPTPLSTPISSFLRSFRGAGVFATGLSRDDAGGLRYLYRAQNYNVENPLANVTLVTNGVSGNVVSPWVPYFGLTNLFTNVFGTTNISGATNTLITTALRPGMETITFVRRDYDSLLSQTFVPITNIYTDIIISNNTAVLQRVQRIISQPDLIFRAEDLGLTPPPAPAPFLYSRGVNFINNSLLNYQGLAAGPGVLGAPAQITFTTLLPGFFNFASPGFLDGPTRSANVWGSFGDSPDSITVFPDSFSLQELEARVLGR